MSLKEISKQEARRIYNKVGNAITFEGGPFKPRFVRCEGWTWYDIHEERFPLFFECKVEKYYVET